MLLHTRAVRCSLATPGGHSSAIVGGAGRGEDGVVRGLAAFGKQRCSGRLAPPHVCEPGMQLARFFLFAHNISGIASQDKGFACPAWSSMHIYLDMQAQLIYRSCYLQSTASAADLSDLDAQMIGGTDALMMTTTTMRSRFR